MSDDERFLAAIEQARAGFAEGGVPVGAVLVAGAEVLGAGRNQRVQRGSPILHGETDCLQNAGRRPPAVYARATLYTTLSPCPMCAGAVLLFKIPRVVVGENRTFAGAESLLREGGVEVVLRDSAKCLELMRRFIDQQPEVWAEDIADS